MTRKTIEIDPYILEELEIARMTTVTQLLQMRADRQFYSEKLERLIKETVLRDSKIHGSKEVSRWNRH